MSTNSKVAQIKKDNVRVPKIITLESRSSKEVDLSELIIDGRLEIFPEVEQKGLVFVQFRRSKAVLSAGAFIGLVPLTPRISVNIEPKLPISNIARVMDVACRSIHVLGRADRSYLHEHLDSNSVLEFLLANLLDAMKVIEVNGIYKAYRGVTVRNSQPRGRIEMIPTMRSSIARGQPHLVSSTQFTQTPDLPANRVLKAALVHCLKALKTLSDGSKVLIREANRLYGDMPKTISNLRSSDLEACQRSVEEHALPSTREYYYPALQAAQLILSSSGISLRDLRGGIRLNSFIVNFEAVFEDYLRNILSSVSPTQIRVLNGNDGGSKSLFDDRIAPPAQPDIILVRDADQAKVIAEVKYKEKVDRSDINQALTYALSYRTKRVLLVHQAKTALQSGLRHHGSIDGIVLDTYAFNLGCENLESEEKRFAIALHGLLN